MRNKEHRRELYPLAENQPETLNRRPRIHRLSEKQLRNFWKRVDKSQHVNCWGWSGGHNGSGRAILKLYGIQMVAPRVSFAIHNNVDPGQWDVLHTCDNASCVYPEHMFLGTPQDNADDRAKKGRFVASCGNTRIRESDPDQMRILMSLELKRFEKAKLLGISEKQVSRWTKKLGLPDGRQRVLDSDERRKVSEADELNIASDTRPYTIIAYDYGISAFRVSDIKRKPR